MPPPAPPPPVQVPPPPPVPLPTPPASPSPAAVPEAWRGADSLDDVLRHDILIRWVGAGHHLQVAATCALWRDEVRSAGAPAVTSIRAMAATPPLLRWAMDSGCRRHPHFLEFAAALGSVESLRWLAEEGGWAKSWQCWGVRVWAAAATAGHLHVLKYAVRHDHCYRHADWLRGCGCPWDADACESAARNKHVEVLKWAHANGAPWTAATCAAAAERGCLGLLKYVRACPWDEGTCRGAAQNGYVRVLEWALIEGCPCSQWTCDDACLAGRLQAVLLMRRHGGCAWPPDVCYAAARVGHLEVLQSARQDGCPWSRHVIDVALRNGHRAVAAWARANGCPVI